MIDRRGYWLVSGALSLGMAFVGGGFARGQAPPPVQGPATTSETPAEPSLTADKPLMHEAFAEPTEASVRLRVPKAPPAPLDETRSDDLHPDEAVWVPGYWTWDARGNDFAWITGAWRVPPAGSVWVSGRWTRDDQGWYWSPGRWNRRRGAGPNAAVGNTDWRANGPPAEHPADDPGVAPGPDAFYVPGHYAPTPGGDRLDWKAGYWARARAGWDWVPARWVRRPSGWDFREGGWVRDPENGPPQRYNAARPALPNDRDLPPAIVESRPVDPAVNDPIAGEEAAVAGPGPVVVARPGPVVVRPGAMPPPPGDFYYYPGFARPARTYYDPLGVIPPFVRGMLDRVMP